MLQMSTFGSDFSSGLLKGYNPVGNLSSYSTRKQGPFLHNGPMNYRQNGRIWNGNDRNKSRDRFYKKSDFETSTELTCGPRASNKSSPLDTAVKEDLRITVQKDQYNQPDFETEYTNAKFYVIKSYNEDDIHKSIKYDVWASTPNGNKKLDAAFRDAEQRSDETGSKCPIFLFFSVSWKTGPLFSLKVPLLFLIMSDTKCFVEVLVLPSFSLNCNFRLMEVDSLLGSLRWLDRLISIKIWTFGNLTSGMVSSQLNGMS